MECVPCKHLAMTLTDRGLVHWLRQDTPDLHFLTTEAASRRRRWAGDERIAMLRDQVDEILTALNACGPRAPGEDGQREASPRWAELEPPPDGGR
jgi:hypothetical protein